ncbi:MAG: hypothetical protein AAF716_17980 [Cyanobacteria bacterium P01_D01_bin.1]
MKLTTFLADRPAGDSQSVALQSVLQTSPLPSLTPSGIPSGGAPGESIRHILLGKPEAIRQTIHLLHTLHYTETILWSPVLTIEEALVITPAQGEAMSLLRKQL